jgi:hypothetical protein
MIFKRSQRSEILSLKRCNAGGGEDGGDRPRKKQRGDEFFPVELLGHVPDSGIPYAAAGFRWCEEPEVASPAGAEEAAATSPPVVRTSRGRALVRPSRFSDSVLTDPWKKEKPAKPPAPAPKLIPKTKVKAATLADRSLALSEVLHRKGPISEDRSSSLSELDDDDEETDRYRACRNFVASRKYSMSLSTLTSLHDEPYSNGYRRKELTRYEEDEEEEEEEKEEQKEVLHWSKQFLYGDIVWARLGKRQPVWPGIVVDPARQAAPEAMPPQPRGGSVLCVMLFGWCPEFDDEKVHFNYCLVRSDWLKCNFLF